ncbi:MAG: hypothetical protein GYA33_03285 [Thermogutta sp.]|nr:hypothetical protein [Thermogutta sp.]
MMDSEQPIPGEQPTESPAWSKRVPFQVDVGGIIQLMGESLYSRPEVAVRELIQNAHDGIMRRRAEEVTFQGRIDLRQDPERHLLEVSDDGIGMTPEEAETYLGTLGLGISGWIKGRGDTAGASNLIGQFGVGLLSGFLLAERIVVVSRHRDDDRAVLWEAGSGTDILLASAERESCGTTVRLHLKPDFAAFAEQEELLESVIRQYAEFLPLPIYLNEGGQRVNVGTAAWLETTPDRRAVEMELESYFGETPLEVIPVRVERPVTVRGALYVTPQRTPGFTDAPTLTVTVRRMVISRRLQGLLPDWAPFIRGVVELPECDPTVSREDLVRNVRFAWVQEELDRAVFSHFEKLVESDPKRWETLIAWHRYLLAGAALAHEPLRRLLGRSYRFSTSQGLLTFEQIFKRSRGRPGFDSDADYVLWYNPNRHQESWMNTLFLDYPAPCVHTLRSFEETLLALMAADLAAEGCDIDVRIAGPGSPDFARSVLGMGDLGEAPPVWQDFLGSDRVRVLVGRFAPRIPVMAFLSERAELYKTFEELKKSGSVPAGFQRLIDAHFSGDVPRPNEVVLNLDHRLVGRALEQSPGTPLGSVVRLLVGKALATAGWVPDRPAFQREEDDLMWIAEALWGRDSRPGGD